MILRNKTAAFAKVDGKVVRPFRTVIVADDIEFNDKLFEIEYIQVKKKKIKQNKGEK